MFQHNVSTMEKDSDATETFWASLSFSIVLKHSLEFQENVSAQWKHSLETQTQLSWASLSFSIVLKQWKKTVMRRKLSGHVETTYCAETAVPETGTPACS
jgi:hypothetical protein